MSEVNVTIGANSAQLQSEFEKVKRSSADLKQSVDDSFLALKGDNKVKKGLGNLIKEMSSAQDATEALGGAIGSLGSIFQSSIAAGVSVAALGMFVNAIANAREEWQKFKEAGKNAMEAINQAVAAGDAEKALGEIAKRMKEVNEQREKASGFMAGLPTDFKGAAIALSGGLGAGILEQQRANEKRVEIGKEQANLEKENLLAADVLLGKKELELQIATLTAEGNTDAVKKIKEQIDLVEELNKINALNLTHNKEELELRDKIIAKIGEKGAQKMRDKPEQQDQHVKDFTANLAEQNRISEEAAKFNIQLAHAIEEVAKAEQSVSEYMMDNEELLASANARKDAAQAVADTTVDSILKQNKLNEVQKEELNILRLMNAENEKAVKLENEKIDKADKAALEADKLRLEGNKQMLKEQEGIVKKGEQEQKQRDDRAMHALQGGGGLQALQAQRLSDRQAEAARDKAAGILARDEVRRAAGGDALRMSKEDIAAAKARILGEKQLDKKKIEAAIAGIPKIEAEIAKLVAKLGVK